MPHHQILERIERARRYLPHAGVLGKHEWQLLLEHEHAGGYGREHIVARLHRRKQLRNVALLEARDSLEIAELEPRHAATAFRAEQRDLDAIVLENGNQVLGERGLVAIAVAGGEHRYPAGRGITLWQSGIVRTSVLCRARPVTACLSACSLAQRSIGRARLVHGAESREASPCGTRVIARERGAAIDAEHLLEHCASGARGVERVDHLHHYRDSGESADRIGGGQHPLAPGEPCASDARGLGAQHEVGKVDIPRMRRHVRAFGHETHVAQVTVIHDLPEHFLFQRAHLAGIGGVHRVEECWKGIAQAEAAPTAVTDIEYPLELAIERSTVVEAWAAPVERMAGRCLEAPFACACACTGSSAAHELTSRPTAKRSSPTPNAPAA
jgi:hypothetical protein